MKTLFDSLKSIVKSDPASTSCFRKSQSLLCRSLVLIIISISVILLMPLAGWTQPPSYEGELAEGQRLVKEFGELTGNPNSSRDAILKKTFEISQSQQAKKILKGSQKGLGNIYNDMVYGGTDSIASRLINRTKAKLKAQGVPQSVLDLLKPIRNKASIDSGSAPMDLDIGINSQGNKALEAQLLKDLGGVKGVKEFEEALQTALESSLTEIAADAGVTGINTENVGIKGTTPWSADSYGQSGILKGDSPDAGYAGQTADVTKTKIDDEEDSWKSGTKSQESAWQEAARGTWKDRPKMENAFNEIYTQTGKRAGWTNEQKRVWDLLEQLTTEGIPSAEINRINAEIEKLTGKDIFGACRQLADAIEAAWKLAPRLKLTPGQFIELLITNRDGSQRRVLIDDQLKMRSQGEPDWKSYEILRDIIAKVRGNQFINSMLATETGKNLLKHASMVAPMALMNIFVKYETGQMNDARDLAVAVIEVLPAANGFILAYVGDKSLLDKEVLNAWLMEGFFWGAVVVCPACAPVLIAGAVGDMAWSLAKFKAGSVRLQNYQSGLVDLFVYNGEFPNGKFAKLVLPGNQVIEGSGLRPFLFETKSVTIRIAVPDWGLRINLSEKTEEVYKNYYLANDPAATQLKDASAQLEKNAGCTANSTEKYCKVYDLIQRQLELRRQEVIDAVMIPHLISLAEAKYATLDASEDLSNKMIDLQKGLEELRGSPLGIKLVDVINKKAKEKADATDVVFGTVAVDTKETKKMTQGAYWQEAFSAYGKIYKETKKLKDKIQKETGYEKLPVLQIQWSGDYRQDQMRIAQSLDGFSDDSKKIHADIQGIKGSPADLQDTVDKQALDILGKVVFPWRATLDERNKAVPESEKTAEFGAKRFPVPEKDSPFYKEYEDALNEVRKLYGKKGDFQTLLGNGAKIVTAEPALMMGKGTEMELVFTDEGLKKDFAAKAFTFKWSASPKGTFSPNDYDQKVTFTAPDPGSVTITVRVERSVPKEEKLNASLAVKLPVKVPDNFVLLELIPATLKPEEKGKADTTLDQPRFIGKLKYKWSGANCQVEDVDRLSTSIIAPKTGQATVTVELFIKDAEEQWVSLITKQVSFNVDGKPDDKPKDDKKDDKKDGQKPPPQVQPGAYTQPSGQAGIQGGTSGQAGITSGVSGQAGVQGGTSGQAGITAGVSGQAGITSGVSGQAGVQSGTSGQTGITPGVSGQTGLTSGVSTGTGVGVTSTPPTPPKEPAACTYEYSAWGDCNRGTKTWTRTVTAKQPAGCVEKGKPVLEGVCTPPPTEEEKRQSYLNCLCACTPFFQSQPWYGSKECGSRGPCESRSFAYSTLLCSFIKAKPECAASCYKNIYGKTVDPASVEKDIKDTNRKHKEPVKIKLNQDKCPVHAQLGDIITLTASVEGGIPPHKVSWSGNGQAKENTFTFANSRQPGPHPISVTVTDDDGDTATAACTVIVEALTVKIELLDKEKKIPIGESRNFSGTVMAGDKPARGDFYFLWQPHPEILFSPFEKTGGNVSGTKAKFNKLGKFKIWVIAHTYKGNIKTTIGESEQIEIEVSKPEIKLSFLPQTPKVGQEVKLTVTENPKMDEKTISFWWEISGNALNPGPLKGEREYTFRPKDNKPVTVTVHGKAIEGGDDLGEDKATVTAQEYEVTIGEPQYRGPKPKIWNPQVWKSPEWKQGYGLDGEGGLTPGGGLVEVADSQFAVFHDIFVKADVKPTPEKVPLRYDWAIAPSGICGVPAAGQELRLNCSQTGTYTVTLSVRDSENVVLGTASRAVSITVSQEDLDNAKRPLVTLQADKTSLKTGETAVIKAAVQGGKAPYAYRWGNGVEGKAETAQLSPKKSGSQNITVEVTDGAGKKNTAAISIKVERAKLEVTLKAAKTDIKLDETVEIKAEAKGGEAPFTYAWGPEVKGKGDSVPYVAKKGGAQTVSVEVTDGARQKAKATVELKVEIPKLEVTLKADKTTLKISETALIQAIVKGGAPPVTSKWSADVVAKGETASFTPKKSGAYKITMDVSDDAKQTANAGIDIKVEPTKLEVTLKTDKTTLKLGETATLQSVVKGGEPPFVSQWGSNVEGKGDSGRFVADKPGTHKASLDVSDKTGQKASASVDLKVEAPKLEVALAPDKPTLKVGETGTIQAKVKGGMPEYTYQWSSFVAGKAETAAFTPKKTGLYKVWLEVRDKMGGKVSASLDWKVEAGQDGLTPPVGGAEKIAIEPENLKLALGTTQTLQILRVLPDGRKEPYTQGKVSWSGAPSQGIVIDDQGKIQADSRAKVGARVRIGAQAGLLKAEAWVELVSSSTASHQAIEPDPLKVAPGGTGELRLTVMTPDGKQESVPAARVKWEVERVAGVSIDSGGKVSVSPAVPAGKRITVTAKADRGPVTGTIEVARSSITPSTIRSTGISIAPTTVPPSVSPTVSPTSVKTVASTTPGGGPTPPPSAAPLPILVMEPASLTIPPGGNTAFRVFATEASGKRADVTNKCTLTVSPGSGVRIDRNGRITVEKTARPGTIEPVLATLKHASGVTLRVNGIIRIGGTATLSSGGYDPKTDPGKLSIMKPEDLDKVKKIGGDFQTGQWKPLDSKEQKIKEQPAGQAQSPGYLSSSTTTTSTVPPGGTTTPTTVPPGGTTTPTTVPSGGTTTPTTVPPGGTTTLTTIPPGGTTTHTTTSSITTTATYINQTKEIAHIFTDGETFAPNNRLTPGEKRNIQVKPLKDGRIKFYAGRNGKVIDSKYWPGTGGDPSRYPMVRFVIGIGGKEELVITTNLK